MKTCSRCQRHLPRVEFYRHRSTKDGLQTACRQCQKARSAEPHRKRWSNIKQRLFNPGHPEYSNYGARGITMHPEWVDSFAAFRVWVNAHLGPCPAGYSLDRRDNNGDYVPGNLRWASPFEQTHNRRCSLAKTMVELPKAA